MSKQQQEYEVEADGVPARVRIVEREEDYVLNYYVDRPKVKTATEAVMKDIKKKIVEKVDLSTEEFVNARELETVKQKFRDQAMELLEKELPETPEQSKKILIGNVLHEMLGLGDIEILLNDQHLEEIVVNSADEPAWVYHKELGWLKSDIEFTDEDEIYNYSSDIGRRVGKNISSLHPLLDAHLPSGDRVNASLYPISTHGNTITIRKFARDPWTITDFIENGTVSKEVAAFLWLCMQYEMNILVSGGTGAGKCLTPDAKITLNDGSQQNIKEIVEKDLTNPKEIEDGWRDGGSAELFSMSEKHDIESKSVDKVWKREAPDQMYRIETASGREIKATPEHPFFVDSKGKVEKKRADQLEEDQYVPSSKKLEVENSRKQLEIRDWCEEKDIEIEQVLENSLVVKSVRGNSVKLPLEVDEKLAELTGLIAGDGHLHIQDDGASRVEHRCEDEIVRKRFMELSEQLFEVKCRDESRDNRVDKSYFHSRTVLEFLNKFMEIPAGKKSGSIKVPEKIIKSDDSTVSGFLKGYFEAECHVNISKSNIEISSKSKEIIEQVSTCLKRFGVFSRLKNKEIEDKKFKKLVVGPESLESFNENIELISDRKQVGLEEALKGENNTNIDLIPSENLLRELKQASKLYDREIAEFADLSRRSVSRYLDGSRKPSRKATKSMIGAFSHRLDTLKQLKTEIDEMVAKSRGSRDEIRDKCIDIIYSEQVERSTVAENSGISESLLTKWKKGSSPGPKKLESVARTVEENSAQEIEYTPINYSQIFQKIEVIRKDLKISPSMIKEETGIDIGQYETGNTETTDRETIRNILELLEEEISESLDLLPEKLEELRNLCSEDIHWDRIENIETFQPETDWVYDLTVPKNHTFLANGIVAHNTSMLNVLMPFIPPSQRVLSIEDTREVSLPEFLHWVPLTTREPNPEGKGGVSMLDLLVNALRMRPDRILVGEVRRKRQAEVLFEAMHTGHTVYSTLHADTAEQTVRRLVNPPIDVPKTMVEAVDINLVMFRDRRRNFRRAMELAEIDLNEEATEVEANVLYEWQSREDEMQKKADSESVYENLKMHTGMTSEEIDENLEEKEEILEWMIMNGISEVDTVGKIIAEYYSNADKVVEVVKNDGDPEKILDN